VTFTVPPGHRSILPKFLVSLGPTVADMQIGPVFLAVPGTGILFSILHHTESSGKSSIPITHKGKLRHCVSQFVVAVTNS
jgi:hypothetical protein